MVTSSTFTSAAPRLTIAERHALLEALRTQFLGLHTTYRLADGRLVRRIYLDSAASNLLWEPAARIAYRALQHYANTHSQLHFGARIMTALYAEAHQAVLDFLQADDRYTAIFCGYGVTACLNRIARVLARRRPDRDVVITTIMEHHANDLPHRKHVGRVVHVPVEQDPDGEAGKVDMARLQEAITRHADRLNYVAITAASNVTGVVNPVHEIARMAHAVGAYVVVDAAQSAAHLPLAVDPGDPEAALDVVVLSGHKIYTPGSPGVLVARKELFLGQEPEEVGGGIVSFVDTTRYEILPHLPEREEAGTPNLPGAIALGATLRLLQQLGMDLIAEDERRLTQYALDRISRIPRLHIYGSHRLEIAERIGVITFNLYDLPHGLVTAALNDYFGIAVRNECFCAQPFVRQLLGIADAEGRAPDSCLDTCSPREQPGMVRISLGLYNTTDDIDAAVEALTDLVRRPDFYRQQYEPVPGSRGDWRHRSFRFVPEQAFSIEQAVRQLLDELRNGATGSDTQP